MPAITLLVKVYDDAQLKQIEELLRLKLEGLKAQLKIDGTIAGGWVRATVSGEDEKAALHYLADEVGLCPGSWEQIQKFAALEGRIVNLKKSNDGLFFDIGVFEPEVIDAVIPLNRLQAQLGDGRKLAFSKFVELFGFHENLPLMIKISSLERDKGHVEAMLPEKQLTTYQKWTDSLLDRLIVLGASQQEIKLALERTGCERDVIDVEPLGLFEFAVVCKLGTDAAGLIPRIGRRLRNSAFTIFNPRRIRGFFEEAQ